jgi:predicted regulator of Ras-like GTPase activity (Roadblock/LC7/MglB family)
MTRPADGARDHEPSEFSGILTRLCRATGATAAALVDREGETVDYAGALPAFDVRVMAAEWQIALRCVRAATVLGLDETEQVVIRAAKTGYQMVWLGEGYALIIQFGRGRFGVSQRAVGEAVRELCDEAEFAVPKQRQLASRWGRWVSIEVRTAASEPRRPVAAKVGNDWCELEVLGRVDPREVARGDVAFRARLKTGAELTLAREPFGRWYVEERW